MTKVLVNPSTNSKNETARRVVQEDGTAKVYLEVGAKDAKHTAAGIPTWSPTVVLICRSTAYVWQSGRDAQFSADCGRMCLNRFQNIIYNLGYCNETTTV
jgi:hypothetical protein